MRRSTSPTARRASTACDTFKIGEWALGRPETILGFRITGPEKYYYLLLALVILIIFVCIRLQNSRVGRAWEAVREDEVAAKAMGINTRNIKLMAFGMGASFGGVAGCLFASMQGFVSPESFGLTESIAILCMVVLGGMGHVPGVVAGAILLSIFPGSAAQHRGAAARNAVWRSGD